MGNRTAIISRHGWAELSRPPTRRQGDYACRRAVSEFRRERLRSERLIRAGAATRGGAAEKFGSPGHRRETQRQRGRRIELARCCDHRPHVIKRHHSPGRLLGGLALRQRRHVLARPSPTNRLVEGGTESAVLVANPGVLHSITPQSRVPALHVGDLVLLDRAQPALLMARRRRRPRLEVLIDPCVEDVDNLAAGRRSTPRADLLRCRQALSLTLAATHQLSIGAPNRRITRYAGLISPGR